MTISTLSIAERDKLNSDIQALIDQEDFKPKALIGYLANIPKSQSNQYSHFHNFRNAIDNNKVRLSKIIWHHGIEKIRLSNPELFFECLEGGFHAACRIKDPQLFEFLLEQCPDLLTNREFEWNRVRVWGLEYAAEKGNFAQVNVLKPFTSNDCDPDHALFMAAQAEQWDMVDHLWPPQNPDVLLYKFSIKGGPDAYDQLNVHHYLASKLEKEELKNTAPAAQAVRKTPRL